MGSGEMELLLFFVVLFAFGFGTRSYVGVLVPGAVFVCAALLFLQSTHPPSTRTPDEVDVLPAVFLGASAIGVLVYVGGVALGRRSRRPPSDSASAH